MKVLQICAYFCLLFPASLIADDLIGVVRSINGQPLQGVFIYSRSQKQVIPREAANPTPFQTITDEEGRFRLTEYGQILFLRKLGYKPLAKKLDLTHKQYVVVMEAINLPQKSAPRCRPNNKQELLDFRDFRMFLDAGYVVENQADTDSVGFTIRRKENNRLGMLRILSGTTVSIGFPDEELLLESDRYVIDSFSVGVANWVTAKGYLSNGTYWRYLGNSTSVISYQAASKETAIFFDKVVDSLCTEQQ